MWSFTDDPGDDVVSNAILLLKLFGNSFYDGTNGFNSVNCWDYNSPRPSKDSNTDTDPQLGWFAGNDDRDNLTFDVYLDTNSDPTTKVGRYYHSITILNVLISYKYYWKVVATDGEDTVVIGHDFNVSSYGNIFVYLSMTIMIQIH